ncbi:hypothetical protein BKA66DRAFT_559829 [Pyrenochaeta sp. MPI-SDFR-AT-0127]|nr:hypothetical protein BKA66DRAFT_559829 [Pyrenochaeta sp. MPI-SDFR-AT-0127]
MQTHRRGRPNRQPREGGRGRGRGSSNPSSNANNTRPPRPRAEYHSVPSFAAIRVGSGVSIVLKEDQPTGHQVRGIVADLLTRGDHPRGVKVRLRDGRVGRVQRLVSEVDGERGEALVGGAGAGLGRNGEGASSRGVGGMVGGRVERDIREDDEYLYDEERSTGGDVGYFAALEEADKQYERRKGGRGQPSAAPQSKGDIAVCPVCGEFEGDELAVAHHVDEHFAE